MFTRMRSTKGHELTLNVVSVRSCDFVDRVSSTGCFAATAAPGNFGAVTVSEIDDNTL